MKRFLSLMLALLMMMSLSVTALAADATNNGGNTSIDVNANYQNNVSTADVIFVDIAWGEMQFTYSVNGTMDWDGENHQYVNNVTEGWTAKGNSVTLTNHSNVAIKAKLSFTAVSDYEGITGSFGDDAELLLASAVGTEKNEAPEDTALLNLTGALSDDVTAATKIGMITVTIEKQS